MSENVAKEGWAEVAGNEKVGYCRSWSRLSRLRERYASMLRQAQQPVNGISRLLLACRGMLSNRLTELLILFEHAEVGVVALGGNLAGIHGLFYGAAGLVGVGAGGETAVVREL